MALKRPNLNVDAPVHVKMVDGAATVAAQHAGRVSTSSTA